MTESEAHEGQVLWLSAPGLDRELYVSALGDSGFATVTMDIAPGIDDWPEGTEGPDIIVVDLLPDPDQTWAFIVRLAARSCSVPVIIFTSLIRPDGANRRKARSLGCAAFVAKPCSLRQFVDVVSRVHRGERGLEVAAYSV